MALASTLLASLYLAYSQALWAVSLGVDYDVRVWERMMEGPLRRTVESQ